MSNLLGYRAVTEAVALSDRSDRVRLEVAGPDRVKFLHNLTTNEVKRLPIGRGCEAFVTSLQGKTLAYVKLLACADSILVCTDPGGLVLALPHFQKYGLFDEVALVDRTETTFEFHLAGPRTAELIGRAGGKAPEHAELAHVATSVAECPLLIVREAPTGRPGLTLIGPRSAAAKVGGLLRSLGADLGLTEIDQARFEAMRIEAGTPVFGRDLTEKNLPQELGRDAAAISFVKGCYLGQETVARIDALGHVNQVLRGLRLETQSGAPPAPGSLVQAEGKRVGYVTSSAMSPGWNAPISLALLRTSHMRAGTLVSITDAQAVAASAVPATVCDLPMLPPSDAPLPA
jgi:folate-binding protein YgfZ